MKTNMKTPLHLLMNTPTSARGFSLVELMIALALGLLLIAGVAQIFDSTRHANQANDALGQLQENGRMALELISRDIREAGNAGCNRTPNLDIRGLPAAITASYGVASVQGIPNGGLAAPAPATTPMAAATEGIYLAGMGHERTSLVASMDNQTSDIRYRAGGSWRANDRLILSDCLINGAVADVFDAPADNLNGLAGVIPSPRRLAVRYPDFAILGPLFAREYYISDPEADGVRSLYRRDLATTPVDNAALIDGVQDMRFRFGIDNDADGTPDIYVPIAPAPNWNNVVSVEISLLLRDTSTTAAHNATDRQTYTFPSWAAPATTTAPVGDFHLYTVMGTTITLRNRTP
jgi:type IV pilus assembly protein PilW